MQIKQYSGRSTGQKRCLHLALALHSIMLAGIMLTTSMLPKALEGVGKIFPATWGFRLMSAETFDGKLLIPLLFSFLQQFA